MNPQDSLKTVKSFISDMAIQYSKATNVEIKDSTIKSGMLVLFIWAKLKGNDEVINNLKKEAERLFTNVGSFFQDAENDLKNLKIEKPEIIENISALSDKDYDSLIEFIQKEIN